MQYQENEKIDWHLEWAKHAYQFQNGHAHIDFIQLGLKKASSWIKEMILLAPGAGFGDFSHPTTRLVLRAMYKHVADKLLLDVGCGSGILSIAACAFGAKSLVGIDIDDEAISHARHNTAINGFSDKCQFGKVATFQPQILLMNMIRSEQKAAFDSLQTTCRQAQEAFTSGILPQERALYLAQTSDWGWSLIEEHEEEGWLGFRFKII